MPVSALMCAYVHSFALMCTCCAGADAGTDAGTDASMRRAIYHDAIESKQAQN